MNNHNQHDQATLLELGVSTELATTLSFNNINTLDDLSSYRFHQIYEMPGIDMRILYELMKFLTEHKLDNYLRN